MLYACYKVTQSSCDWVRRMPMNNSSVESTWLSNKQNQRRSDTVEPHTVLLEHEHIPHDGDSSHIFIPIGIVNAMPLLMMCIQSDSTMNPPCRSTCAWKKAPSKKATATWIRTYEGWNMPGFNRFVRWMAPKYALEIHAIDVSEIPSLHSIHTAKHNQTAWSMHEEKVKYAVEQRAWLNGVINIHSSYGGSQSSLLKKVVVRNSRSKMRCKDFAHFTGLWEWF